MWRVLQNCFLTKYNKLQKKYWSKLKAPQKIAIMDILLSLLEFAASYNSYANLRTRMHQIPEERLATYTVPFAFHTLFALEFSERSGRTFIKISSFHRPPLNLLRQELAGTCIYLDILQKTTSAGISANKEGLDDAEQKIEGLAEAKLVTFCEQVLREASELQSSVGETTNMDIHRVLQLRSPIIVKV